MYSVSLRCCARSLAVSVLLVSSLACQKAPSQSPVSNLDVPQTSQMFRKESTVCDPFGGNGPSGAMRSGLQGRLYALSEDLQGKLDHVHDYITQGMDAGKDIFLNDLNVPTRMFTSGFPVADGSLLQFGGKTLIEYFGLHLESQIQLGTNDPEGNYQFALLSDDGAVLSFDGIGADGTESFNEFLGNDGVHPTRMACATKTVRFSQFMTLPMRLEYYQGPRYHISLVLMWRKVDSPTNIPDEPLCGQLGNNLFFDPSVQPSTEQQAYKDLLARGWHPLNSENYVIPGEHRINPCNDPGFFR